jgi:PhnB protein
VSAVLNPYLNFRGQAKAAMEFYQSVFGGELVVNTFAEFGGMGVPEAEQGNVMHSQLTGPDGLRIMGADVPSSMEHSAPSGFAVSLSGDDEATLRGWWEALSVGAVIGEPLAVAPWGDAFGMLTDAYGVPWMVNILISPATSD